MAYRFTADHEITHRYWHFAVDQGLAFGRRRTTC